MSENDKRVEPEYVWYACYGSNLSTNRFKRYIDRCRDKMMPTDIRPFRFPHSIYFAKAAKSWDNGGKAFLDDTASGSAYGRIYKITKEQYHQIKRQEGADYTKRLQFGTIEGIPVYSFTDIQRNQEIRVPSAKYFQTILTGLAECYGGIVAEKELVQYLIDAVFPKNTFAAVKAIKQNAHYLTNREISERTGLNVYDTAAAVKWLLEHQVIKQDSRSIRAGHGIADLGAYFYTVDSPCARELIAVMLDAVVKAETYDSSSGIEENASGAVEGGRRFTYLSRIERKKGNRIAAICLHGCKCMACGFDFAEIYGDHGKNFIEVHHLNPLAEQGETVVDPETELVCLCANCHAMVHRYRGHMLSLEELRRMLGR